MNTFQFLTLLFAAIGFLEWAFLFYKLKFYRWGILALLLYELHTMIFYVSFLIFRNQMPVKFWNTWSNIVRLHILFYFIAAGLIFIYEWKKKNV